jgi:DNA-binding response OmpR family regulator
MSERASSPHASDRAKRRRLAAETRAHAARILVCECREDGATPLFASVRALGYEAIPCASLADALRETAKTAFDVVLAALPAVNAEQVSLLQLLRRSHATTPLVLVSEDGSLEARARVQPVRPYFFAVPPVSETELRAILSGAVGAASRS